MSHEIPTHPPAPRTLHDVVVLGGGAAGLSAATTLARARRSVVVVDAGEPRNAPAAHMHGFLSRDGAVPGDVLAAGRAEVERYGGTLRPGTATSVRHLAGGAFEVTLADATTLRARQLVVATGLIDELPDVPGVAQRWGRDVLHCPYCHGAEVADQAIGVLGAGALSVHQALLWRQWSRDVTLFLHTSTEPDDDAWEQLAARGVRVVDGVVERLEVTDDRLTGVRLASGTVIPVDALVVRTMMRARADVLAGLGLVPEPVEVEGVVVGSQVPHGPTCATAVPGVWVAGNVADVFAQVVAAAADGVRTGAAVNGALIAADTRAAVESHRDPFSATAEREVAARALDTDRHPDRHPDRHTEEHVR